jgi:DNA-directed RNA polymerase subunit beta
MKVQNTRPKKYFGKYREPLAAFPNLLETQVSSFKWFLEVGLKEVFQEFSPINDYSTKKFTLKWDDFTIGEVKTTEEYAKENKLTYEVPLKARVSLLNRLNGQTKEQEIFLTDIPMMTPHGTFIINGVERVLVSQLARSFGVFFTDREAKGKKFFGAKIIPGRGVWIEIDTEADGVIYVRIDKKRKFPMVSLFRVFGVTDEKLIEMCQTDEEREAMALANRQRSSKVS